MGRYQRTYAAIKEMIGDELLAVPLARGIVRKGAPRMSGEASAPVSVIDLLQEFNHVDTSGGNHSQYGTVLSHSSFSPEQLAGPSVASMHAFWDFEGIGSMRLLANVTLAGPSGGAIELQIRQNAPDSGFFFPYPDYPDGPVSVPVTVGFHDSGWKQIDWWPEDLDGRPAGCEPYLINPTGTSGTMGLGLLQILLKAEGA